MARIAFCSPLPPAQTGIATYAAAVLDGLARIGATERHGFDAMWPLGAGSAAKVDEADLAIYQIGNNVEFHDAIYHLSVWHPGVVVLHDLALDGLMQGLRRNRDPLAPPARAEAVASTPRGADPDDPLGIPWCAQVVRRARAVIVHSRFARDYLHHVGCRTPVLVAPHPLVERDQDVDRARARREELRGRVSRGGEVVVGIAGQMNESKGISPLLEALAKVRTRVRVVLAGRLPEHTDLHATIQRFGLADRVTIVANPSDDDFLAWLCAFDVLVNVRDPHRGETSGSLVRALHVGVPSIVSAVGTYLEVPDDAVVRIPAGPPDPDALAVAIEQLASDADLRARIGERARAYAHDALDPTITAHVYEDAIDAVLALQTDPARAGLRIWAEALQEVGVGPQHVRRGLGVRYAEAVGELASPA